MNIAATLRGSVAPVILAAAMLSPSVVHAQDVADEGMGDDVIIVTGSRISNPNLEQSSPVSVVGSEEMSLRQATNAEELIGSLPGVAPGIDGAVNNGSSGYSSFNLRGLGDNRNLVLLDGTRIVPSSLSSVTDLNVIPVALVERAEIVTGGASSVYGADAIAGVVNFVTKRDFSGVDISSTFGLSEEGDAKRFRTDVTIGGNFEDGRGNAVLSVGYQKNGSVLQGDRSFSKQTLYVDGSELGSGTAVPTRVNGNQYDPSTGTLVPTYSSYNFAPDNYYYTPLERYNVFGAAHYEVSDGIEVYTKGMFTKSKVKLRLASSGMFGDTYQLPLNNPFLTDSIRQSLCDAPTNASAIAAAGGCAAAIASGLEVPTTINRRFVEMGPRETEYSTNQFQIWGGVRGDISSTIKFDIYGTYGESDRTQTNTNWGLKSRVQQALRATDETTCLDTSNGCSPLNLFGDGQSISSEAIAFINAPAVTSVKTALTVVNGSINGTIGDTGFLAASTPIGFAIGAEYRKYKASQLSDAASSTQDEVMGTGAPSPSFSGTYNVKELFGELIVPLVEDVPGIYNLTAEGGVRYSDYSTSGSAWTYKGGGSYEPIRGLKIRSIYQRSVRSPNIEEMFLPVTTGLENLTVDPCQGSLPVGNAALTAICIAQGAPASMIGSIPAPSAGQVNATSGGNVALKPEKADSFTVGAVLTPAALPGLAITVDYYNIKVKDAITTPTPGDILDPCFVDGDASACALVGRNPLNGSLNGGGDTLGLIQQLTNQGRIQSTGIDLNVNYRTRTSFGGLSFDFNGNWTDKYRFQASPTSINRECVGQYSENCDPILPEFSFNARATASVDGVGDFSILWTWLDSTQYEKLLAADLEPGDMLEEYQSISAYSYFDLGYRGTIGDNFEISFLIKNLFDKKPPIVSSYVGSAAYNSGNTYPSTYDVIGRRFTLTTSIRF